MAEQYDRAQQRIREFTTANPQLFAGLDPRNIIAHLGIVAPGLWNELNTAYGSEIGNSSKESLNEWGFRNPEIGQSLLQALPAQPTPNNATATATDYNDPNTIKSETDQASQDYQNAVNAIYDQLIPYTTDKIQRAAAPGRSKLLSEEAALGRLTSPVSIANTSRYDEQTQNSLSDAIASLSAQRASGQLDLTKTIQGIQQAGRTAEQQGQQFSEALAQKAQENQLNDQTKLQVAKISKTPDQQNLLQQIMGGVNVATGLFGKGQSGGLFF